MAQFGFASSSGTPLIYSEPRHLRADFRSVFFAGVLWMNFRRLVATSNPYCSFRSDKERLRALVSRDIRIVLVAAAVGLTYELDRLRWVVEWLLRAA